MSQTNSAYPGIEVIEATTKDLLTQAEAAFEAREWVKVSMIAADAIIYVATQLPAMTARNQMVSPEIDARISLLKARLRHAAARPVDTETRGE